MQIAVKGLRIGIKHWMKHAETGNELNKTTGLCSQKKPRWLQHIMDMFHQLYRPHYNHQVAPPRFANGIKAELTYDDSYTVDMVDAEGLSTPLPMPCPVFQSGMFMRAEILGYDYETGTYDLQYCDGPYLCDEPADGEKNLDGGPGSKVFVKGVNGAFLIVDLYDVRNVWCFSAKLILLAAAAAAGACSPVLVLPSPPPPPLT